LSDNGVVFCTTTDKLNWTNLLKAIQYGFDKTKALEALDVPASLLGKSNEIGTQDGSLANF
jgi:hypothetical protein